MLSQEENNKLKDSLYDVEDKFEEGIPTQKISSEDLDKSSISNTTKIKIEEEEETIYKNINLNRKDDEYDE
jgi:hypothetical protein